MRNILKKSLFVVLGIVSTATVFAASGKEPSEVLDVSAKAGSNAYYSVVALPAIKDQAWVGYNSTGSGSGDCISESHWKLSDSRTITFKVKNCDKIEIVDSYFSKDATTNLLYSINGATAASFVTNGTEKKSCQSGSFATYNTGEITVVISADNDVALGTINFYKAGSGGDSGGGDSGGGDSGGGDSGGGDSGGGDSGDGGDSGSGDSGSGDSGSGDSGNLTTHVPDIYDAKTVAGGYGGTLSVVGGREYETYYASFLESGALSVTITPVQKSEGITTSISTYNCKAKDGWMEMKTSTSKSNYTMSAIEEFKGGEAATHKLLNNAYYKMHVSGFDQFSFYGKDNTADESKGKHFEVYIDNVKRSMTTATSASIRRFDMTSGEHLIEVRGVGASNNEFYAFSLRVSDQPRTRWIKGNDSTQTILQTQAPKAVYYYTKYNSKGETKLEWDGAEATGISLSVKGSSDIGDTLVLGGVANCPTGDYKYNVVTYMNGQETSRASGKFKVISDIKVKSESTTVDAYQQEEMEEIEFRYYALDASAITLSWKNDNAPAGITTSDDATEHIFTISGTPTAPQGDYPFSVTIAGSETVITGVIKVWSSDLGENPVLYLYKTKGEKSAYDNDGIYEYLKSKDVNLIPRTAIKKLRSADQYAKFKWILISEDVDADNEEVLEIIKGGSGLPVLNLKGFTYTADRLGWGEPDNGTLDTISNNGCNIFIEREDHPIFKSFNLKHGAKLQIFNKLQPNSNGVMPINIDLPGSLCLATAYTRNIEYYYQDGELQTVIHEIPADQREGKKYICVPLAMSNSKNLSADGKKLFNEIVKYLMDDTEYPVSQRTLKINSFRVNNLDATIKEDRIDLVYNTIQHPEMNIKALAPEIVLEDELTHVTPASGDTIDFTYSLYMPVVYVVTDFINRHVYEVVIQAYGSQGLEEITYTVGEWVNIYDIYGRLIATTNENIHTMDLPRGMYIAVTENGKSIKLMK